MEKRYTPKTLEELKKTAAPIHNVNIEQIEKLGKLERTAVFVTEKVGTMGFFLIILFWTSVWLIWNTLGPESLRFDPFPAFVLWLFISNMIQLFLSPLIMVGQNLQSRHAEARAENDYNVNVKSEQEVEAILQHLENQNDLILQILENQKKRK